MGLDVSGSVDSQEYFLQLNGLAAALLHEDVRHALLSMPSDPVSLAVYEWSGPTSQKLLADWSVITNRDDLNNFTTGLLQAKRRNTDPSTAIGSSIIYGADLLSRQKNCTVLTLDLSGDGPSNFGPLPRNLPNHPLINQITVNALAIQTSNIYGRSLDLEKYFEAEVIRGTDAFVEKANGFEHFEAAMIRKLLRELRGLNLSRLQPNQ